MFKFSQMTICYSHLLFKCCLRTLKSMHDNSQFNCSKQLIRLEKNVQLLPLGYYSDFFASIPFRWTCLLETMRNSTYLHRGESQHNNACMSKRIKEIILNEKDNHTSKELISVEFEESYSSELFSIKHCHLITIKSYRKNVIISVRRAVLAEQCSS